jgi:alpha-beta hydrolase superfamily lysophospholipase
MRIREQRLLNSVQRPEVYEEVLIRSAGTPIALSVWRGESEAPCVLFLPGTMTHPLFYEELLDGIARTGFNVVGVHLQGHGKSPRTNRLFSFEDLVQNGVDAVSYTIERFGNDVFALGSSQGGILAMALAGKDQRIKAVFAHNILDSSMPESLRVTRFPGWLQAFYGVITRAMAVASRVLPSLPVPLSFYLDDRRVFGEWWTREQFYSDPMGRTSYPLYFLVSLFTADMGFLTSGEIRCPVIVIASTGDQLFPFDYTRKVYERVVASRKEMLLFELDRHLILNECVEEVLSPLVGKLKEYTAVNANRKGSP